VLVRRYMSLGLKRDVCLKICGLSKNQFYYKSAGKKRGRKKTRHTLRLVDGKEIKRLNFLVIEDIKSILKEPNADYGYRKMASDLQLLGWFINHKKVYRLMKSKHLLRPKVERETKNYVKYRVISPEGPLRLLEQDIKQVWVAGQGRYAYVLTIIDVFTRFVLHYSIGFQMKQADVKRAWLAVIENWLQPLNVLAWEVDIEVRNDNGPQFRAIKLQQFLKENAFSQTFTHPYTPQENGHVESFHAILGRNLRGKIFENLEGLIVDLNEFYCFYNYRRIHNSTCRLPPALFWQQWNRDNIERVVLDEKKRKVKFKLKVTRQQLHKFEPAGNENQREVLSVIFEGSIPDKIKLE